MRLLILSSNNGQGHNSVAKALLECAEKRGEMAVMIDALVFDAPYKSELVERIHVESALHAPRLFEKGTQLAERIEESGKPTSAYHTDGRPAQRLARFIRDNRFDTVVATHIFAAQMLTSVKAEFRRELTTAFIATDYSYVPFTSDTDLDVYFLPHRDLIPVYESYAPGKNYIASGIPTRLSMRSRAEKSKARAMLGLPADAPVALVMTGSMGFGDVPELVDALLSRHDTVRIIVMCGTNDKLRETLQSAYPADERVKAIAYTDKVGLYMDASDVLLSKPGGLSSTEAAVKEIPFVHITPLPGWEEDNVRFFGELGLSFTGETPEEMANAAVRLLVEPGTSDRMMQCQHNEINKCAAEAVIDELDKLKTAHFDIPLQSPDPLPAQ